MQDDIITSLQSEMDEMCAELEALKQGGSASQIGDTPEASTAEWLEERDVLHQKIRTLVCALRCARFFLSQSQSCFIWVNIGQEDELKHQRDSNIVTNKSLELKVGRLESELTQKSSTLAKVPTLSLLFHSYFLFFAQEDGELKFDFPSPVY